MSQIQDLITATAQQYGVDPALALSVAQQESGFNQSAISSAGAVGVFQLMPATASTLGVNPNDLAQNIDGGVRYLKQMLDRFGGDTSLALAAYNAGPGNVQRYGGIPPFTETQNYVSSILQKISNWIGAGDTAPADGGTVEASGGPPVNPRPGSQTSPPGGQISRAEVKRRG